MLHEGCLSLPVLTKDSWWFMLDINGKYFNVFFAELIQLGLLLIWHENTTGMRCYTCHIHTHTHASSYISLSHLLYSYAVERKKERKRDRERERGRDKER